MTPGKLNLTIYQGSTWRRVIRLATVAGAVDLSGATARMHVRATVATTTTLLELTESNGRALITDAANGEITLLISATDTVLLTFTSGVYDLEIEYASGTVDRVLYGTVKLSKEVTR
jgi:DUF4097 and DUF4098 domain-containing protein YvlB